MKSLNFLIELGEQPKLRDRFVADADKVLGERNIATADRRAFVSRDSAQVREVFGISAASLPPKVVTAPMSAMGAGG